MWASQLIAELAILITNHGDCMVELPNDTDDNRMSKTITHIAAYDAYGCEATTTKGDTFVIHYE